MTLMYLSCVVQVTLNTQTMIILPAFLSVLILQSDVNSIKMLIDVVL